MATFEDVRRLGLRLPEVQEAPSYRAMPALKVRGKPFCRLWSAAEHDRSGVSDTDVIVVFCDAEDKEPLLQAHPGGLFTTPHYDGYAALLVRLADVDLRLLAELLVDSYRLRAPKALARGVVSDVDG